MGVDHHRFRCRWSYSINLVSDPEGDVADLISGSARGLVQMRKHEQALARMKEQAGLARTSGTQRKMRSHRSR